jgi:chromosomal replication initiation ATPase DnaA
MSYHLSPPGIDPDTFSEQACRTVRAVATRDAAIPARALDGAGRGPARLSRIRQLAIYLAHVELGLPADDVARGFKRSRKAVAHACRQVEDRREARAFDRRVSTLAAQALAEMGRP